MGTELARRAGGVDAERGFFSTGKVWAGKVTVAREMGFLTVVDVLFEALTQE